MGRKKLDEYECDWCGHKVYKPEAPRNSLPDGWQWLYLSGDRLSAGTDEEPELVCDSEVNAIASLRRKRQREGKPQKGYIQPRGLAD